MIELKTLRRTLIWMYIFWIAFDLFFLLVLQPAYSFSFVTVEKLSKDVSNGLLYFFIYYTVKFKVFE